MTLITSNFTDVPSLMIGTIVLLALLGCAIWFDIKSRRIPNRLVLVGLILSFLNHSFSGLQGVQSWALGMLVGFALLLPLHLVRAMGAGDVKLMAMVGSFVGPVAAMSVVVATLIAGGLLAALVALKNGVLVQTLSNVRLLLSQTVHQGAASGPKTSKPLIVSAGSLPYAVAIAVGTAAQLLLSRNGQGIFI